MRLGFAAQMQAFCV